MDELTLFVAILTTMILGLFLIKIIYKITKKNFKSWKKLLLISPDQKEMHFS